MALSLARRTRPAALTQARSWRWVALPATVEALVSLTAGLDSLRPGYEHVRTQVENGGGTMPAFKGQLTPARIRDVAAFVTGNAGVSSAP